VSLAQAMLAKGRNRRRNRVAERFDSFIYTDEEVNWEERMLFKALEVSPSILVHLPSIFAPIRPHLPP